MSKKKIDTDRLFSELDLEELGFERNDVSIEESGADAPYTYYTYDMEASICLISGEIKKGDLTTVEIFEGDKPLSREFVNAVVKEFKN